MLPTRLKSSLTPPSDELDGVADGVDEELPLPLPPLPLRDFLCFRAAATAGLLPLPDAAAAATSRSPVGDDERLRFAMSALRVMWKVMS